MSFDERLAFVTRALAAAGREAAAFEARQLVESFNSDERLNAAVRRLLSGEPLQYILGEWEFWGLPFKVGEGVLIPQPDTEILVERSLELIGSLASPRVLDLCSGSGCVAVSIAKERPDASVTAVELYDRAFGFLEENIALNGVKVSARRADVLQKPEGFGEFDLIVSNPPYITADEMKTLPAEVLREPHEALLGGADGLTFYRAIAENWLPLLGNGGAFAVEIGCSQAKGVSDIFAAFSPQTDRDYSGLDRVVYGFKPTDSG